MHSPEVMQMAGEAADRAVEMHGAARGTHTWEIARDAAALAIVQTTEAVANTPPPDGNDLIGRLHIYCRDWRTRAGSKDIVEEAIDEIMRLRAHAAALLTFSHIPPIAAEKDDA